MKFYKIFQEINRYFYIFLILIALTGCSSIPTYPDMNGVWNYELIDHKTKNEDKGTMTLKFAYLEVSGKSKDKFGECNVSGTVASPEFVLRFKDKNNFLKNTFDVEMDSYDDFSGEFRSYDNREGRVSATRVQTWTESLLSLFGIH